MEIIFHQNQKELLEYLPTIKASLKEWMFVDIRLTDICDPAFTIEQAAHLVQALFKDKEGKLYICKDREALMLVRWGHNPTSVIADNIGKNLPEGNCEVYTLEPTKEGIAKLAVLITCKTAKLSLADIRGIRKQNVLLIADDDMFQRTIIKKTLSPFATIIEVESGDKVAEAYRKHNPDILFLDIHMPGRSGRDVVYDISEADQDSYVIMVSADASQTNVADTWQKGARDFLTKPYTKERLLECTLKCSTLNWQL